MCIYCCAGQRACASAGRVRIRAYGARQTAASEGKRDSLPERVSEGEKERGLAHRLRPPNHSEGGCFRGARALLQGCCRTKCNLHSVQQLPCHNAGVACFRPPPSPSLADSGIVIVWLRIVGMGPV